ncbi:MAG: 16S rRNA (uracil(1498)-N(3))-methyltransferase [Sulfurimonas sp.]|uniref:16S rRNA (uracil(1498)-N(3))-methyltransferase n=1 Tax=Sulfurimonas sp. TaxID=2022749 RepID=UPI0026223DFE|nr:16S rRNA (uracil(1498)-N(3))-methyltransferase [Sulfurimonas sp.]MCW8895561.1 16S rRNA (uracil(1498)-N(3))-methyltransferase [Sulfurimonas sp.]MCW8954723.1 16S rRNA (uracil(1498)-N(3))-methyltransferase [Sulfurimonas sp.]
MALIYTFHDEAGEKTIHVKGELYKYLVKVRRHVQGDELCFRSRKDIKNLHKYRVQSVESRSLELLLTSSHVKEVKSKKSLHVAWCIIDSKSIEKVLPSLCEIGVERISFISCDRSQRNFKLDFKRFERILEASMQQSGRSSYIEFNTYKNIKEFITEFPDTKVFDFCDNTLDDSSDFKRVLVGCEGGFSRNEKEFLSKLEVFRLDTPMVLRSESAVMAVASKILL